MSVAVQGLTKIYGAQKAIDTISFEAKQGEVLGFLGPNGAGKTTTMKILTCFIPQTSGEATVCGYDVRTHPLEVRSKIGYLPEHNPLYKELYVKEYLSFVAGLHKIKNKKQKVAEMIEQTGLGKEQNKIIGKALLHDPEVLILDEPTTGLDPNQLAEIRSLIKQLGQEKTVIFSTHIMQEVQAVCDRVLIINNGQLVANDSIHTLQNRMNGASNITIELAQAISKDQLSKIPKVASVESLGDNRWKLTTTDNQDIRAAIFDFAVQQKLTLLELKKETYSVEDVFQELTK